MPSFRSAARAGIVAVLVLGLVPAAAHASSSSAKTAALQVALKALHYYSGTIDGIRGPETIRGTKRFQHAHHLTADGIAGSQTRKALGVRGRPSLAWNTRALARVQLRTPASMLLLPVSLASPGRAGSSPRWLDGSG